MTLMVNRWNYMKPDLMMHKEADGQKNWLHRYLGWVTARPDAIAFLTYDGGVSYGAFHKRVLCYAREFSKLGKGTIGVMATGSVEMNACILASFLAGKTIVPLHPEWPQDRQVFALKESKVELLVSPDNIPFPQEIIYPQLRTVFSQTLSDECGHDELSFFDAASCETPAYILFTSGSTGKPKGVPVPFRCLNAFKAYYLDDQRYGFSSTDRFLQVYDATFDVFYFPFLLSLETGGTCCLLPQKKQIRSLLILEALQHYRITVLSMVPTVLQIIKTLIKGMSFPDLRLSFFSGDILYRSLAETWEKACSNAVIYNCYGPTETTIVCTTFCWNDEKGDTAHPIVPMGFPFPGTTVAVMLEGTRCATGETGELFIGGPQVFNGYLGQESSCLENGWFPSGDLVHLDDRGCLHFHGRKDFQVKIGGYRVETEEVAVKVSALLQKEVVVLARRDQENNNILVAFVKSNLPVDTASLTNRLKDMLPVYMIPGKYRIVEEWPYNNNGKIDRQKLITLV